MERSPPDAVQSQNFHARIPLGLEDVCIPLVSDKFGSEVNLSQGVLSLACLTVRFRTQQNSFLDNKRTKRPPKTQNTAELSTYSQRSEPSAQHQAAGQPQPLIRIMPGTSPSLYCACYRLFCSTDIGGLVQ